MYVIRVTEAKLYPGAHQKAQLEQMFDVTRQIHNTLIERARNYYNPMSPDPFDRMPPIGHFDCVKEFGKRASTTMQRGRRKTPEEFRNDVLARAMATERYARKCFFAVLRTPDKNKASKQKHKALLKKHGTIGAAVRHFRSGRKDRLAANIATAEAATDRYHQVEVTTEGAGDLLQEVSANNVAAALKVASDTVNKFTASHRSAYKAWRKALSAANGVPELRQKADKVYQKKRPRLPKFWNYRDNNIYFGRLDAFTKKPGSPFDGGTFTVANKPQFEIKVRGGDFPPYARCRTFKIVRRGKDYFVQVAYEREVRKDTREPAMVGIDVGVKVPLATSDGELIAQSERALERTEKENRKIAKEEKKFARMQELNGKSRWSKRMLKQKAKITAIRRKGINRRNSWQDRTARKIADTYTHIVVENLNYATMLQSAKAMRAAGKKVRTNAHEAALNRGLASTASARHINKIKTVAEEWGAKIRTVEPELTSQTCSHCLHVSKHSRVNRDRFHCTNCGYEDHADLNAAKAILIKDFDDQRRYEDDPSIV